MASPTPDIEKSVKDAKEAAAAARSSVERANKSAAEASKSAAKLRELAEKEKAATRTADAAQAADPARAEGDAGKAAPGDAEKAARTEAVDAAADAEKADADAEKAEDAAADAERAAADAARAAADAEKAAADAEKAAADEPADGTERAAHVARIAADAAREAKAAADAAARAENAAEKAKKLIPATKLSDRLKAFWAKFNVSSFRKNLLIVFLVVSAITLAIFFGPSVLGFAVAKLGLSGLVNWVAGTKLFVFLGSKLGFIATGFELFNTVVLSLGQFLGMAKFGYAVTAAVGLVAVNLVALPIDALVAGVVSLAQGFKKAAPEHTESEEAEDNDHPHEPAHERPATVIEPGAAPPRAPAPPPTAEGRAASPAPSPAPAPQGKCEHGSARSPAR